MRAVSAGTKRRSHTEQRGGVSFRSDAGGNAGFSDDRAGGASVPASQRALTGDERLDSLHKNAGDELHMPKAPVPAAMGAWHLPFPSSWPTLPRPTDYAQSNAPGLDPDRVLVVGSGPAAGWGVRSHELGLPGQLARRLAAATGRGSDVDILSSASLPVRGAARGLRD